MLTRVEVQERLGVWAVWLSARELCGSGYPRCNPIARQAGRSASTEWVPVDAVVAEHTHRAVMRLRAEDVGMWLVVMCRWVGDPDVRQSRCRPMVWAEVARRMQRDESTCRALLMRAEAVRVAELLGRPAGW